MALTITSTTPGETQEMLSHAVSEDWRTPPSKPEPKENGKEDSIRVDELPPKEFAKVREEQIKSRKESEWEFRRAEENGGKSHKGGGLAKRIDRLTAQKAAEQARADAAEARAAELEARLNGTGAQGAKPPGPSQQPAELAKVESVKAAEVPTKAEHSKQFGEAAKRYPDFKQTLETADRSGVRISESLESAILANPNSTDIAYFLAKNPTLIPELEKDHTRVAQIASDLKGVHSKAAQSGDLETARQQQLFHSHSQRVGAALKAEPDAQKLLAASNVPIAPNVTLAIVEQPNSEQVAIHLARHPELLTELNRLPASAAISKVARLAEQLESKAASNRVKPKPPEPIQPVGGSVSRTGLSLEEIPLKDFIRERNRQERARRR